MIPWMSIVQLGRQLGVALMFFFVGYFSGVVRQKVAR